MAQLPESVLNTKLPGRDRTYLDLGYHVFMIPVAFLDAVKGGELTFEHFERKPPEDIVSADHVIAFGNNVRKDIKAWWYSAVQDRIPDLVNTYYGQHTTHSVLERTTWHAAQHTRQLMALVINQGLSPDGQLGKEELEGLPLPDDIYDNEVILTR